MVVQGAGVGLCPHGSVADTIVVRNKNHTNTIETLIK